jgi:sterol desaturase/sphingolipid hydroxylase (fatty acid hydroxylase superfamily)
MTVLTAARDHPMERALGSMIVTIPAAMVDMPAENFLMVMLMAKMIGLIKHSNLLTNWGWFGKYVIQSPAAHRVHHSIDPVHYNTNFSSLFQFWDILFKTSYHPQSAETKFLKIGVNGDSGQLPAINYLWRIYSGFIKRTVGM